MTRAEILRVVSAVIDTLDEYVHDAASDSPAIRRALGLHPDSAESTYAAATRVMGALGDAAKRVAELEGMLKSLVDEVGEHRRRAASPTPSTVVQSRSPLSGSPTLAGGDGLFSVADLQEARDQLSKVREVLNAPADDSTVEVAERRMKSILDLRAKVDNQDREIAQALSGLFHGDSALLAVQKLAAHYRATSVLENKPASPPLIVVSKDAAQADLSAHLEFCAIGEYEHRKGGRYIVFAHTVDEATLQPLVHYYSIAKKTRWTRTFANFVELVDGKPRFERVGYGDEDMLKAARGEYVE